MNEKRKVIYEFEAWIKGKLYELCYTISKLLYIRQEKKYIIKQHNQLLNIIDITSVDTYSIKHRQQILKVYGTKRKITQ